MSDFSIRVQAARDALAKVTAGARAGEFETEMVDFKVEAGIVDRKGTRTGTGPNDERSAAALAIEVACLANGKGGVLVVGVADDLAGPDALVGTYLDLDWLKQRIWSLTTPSYSGFFIEEHVERGVRLYLIIVEPAFEEIRAGGKLRARRGTSCVELTGDDARRFLEERRRYDWSADPSGLRLSEADPIAVDIAANMYARRHESRPASPRELASRLGVLVSDGDDPGLTRAGALLLAGYERGTDWAQLLITDAEGRPARHDLRGHAPLIRFLDDAFRLLDDVAFPATPVVHGLVRRELRAVPRIAYREVLVNAVMHRDYRLERQAIYSVVTGVPGSVLKVQSPGGLPPHVRGDRLLATPSTPRNQGLAHALWAIGVAERQGIGIKSMYHAMLRDGHDAPEIVEQADDLVVVLTGGTPDVGLRAFFDEIEGRDRTFERDPSVVIAIRELLVRPTLRSERLAEIAQRTLGEARTTLARLESAGVVERLLDGSLTFRLAGYARDRLGKRVRYRRSSGRAQRDLVVAYLDQHPDVSRAEVAALLDIKLANASKLLTGMVREGELGYVRERRGRSVRYRRTTD